MAFNWHLAARSQGVNPSMYDDDPAVAQRMFAEDLRARIKADPNKIRNDIFRQRALEAQGKAGEAVPEEKKPEAPAQQQGHGQQAPAQQGGMHGNEMGDAPMAWPGMNPAAHFDAHKDMISATNEAWSREMDSRREQAAAEQDRQHEYDMESLRQQGAQGYGQPASDYQAQANAARQARNRSLLAAAGFGGHTVVGGSGGVKVYPHAFGASPIATALLGD